MKFIIEAVKAVDHESGEEELVSQDIERTLSESGFEKISIETRWEDGDIKGDLPGFRAWMLNPNACVDRWGEPYGALVRLQDGRDVYVKIHSKFYPEIEGALREGFPSDAYLSQGEGWRPPRQAPGLLSNLGHETLTVVMQGEDPVREDTVLDHTRNEGNL